MFCPAPATAPLVVEECEAELEAEEEVEVPVADVALPVLEADEPVSVGPDDADAVGPAVSDVTEDPGAVALPPAWSLSRPAVMVTGNRLFERSLTTWVIVPGSFAWGPASVSTQVAVSVATLQSTSIVLRVVSQDTQVGGIAVSRVHSQSTILSDVKTKSRRPVDESDTRSESALQHLSVRTRTKW